MTELGIIRQEIEKFLSEISRENYMHYSGQKEQLEIQPIYNRFGHLFTKNLAFELRDLMEKSEPVEGENIRNLFTFILFGWVGEKLKVLNEEQANREAELKISCDSEEVPYRSVPVKIMNVDDSDLRKKWFMAKVEMDRLLTDEFYKPRWQKSWDMTGEMGYGAYLPTVEKLHDLDYRGLSGLMADFIDETEELYVNVFDEFARNKIGKPLSECGYWDGSYLLRGKEHDEIFPADRLLPVIEHFFEDFGFPLDKVDAITLDVEARPKKVPRAFCAAVKVGEEVYINLQPVGGHKDYTTLLHEAGHAYHYAFANPGLNVDVKYLGDRAISEGFAFLFNYLPENPEWCRHYLNVENSSELVYSELRQKLFFLRRYGAKLAYEVELHKDNSFEQKDKIYKDKLQNAVKFETIADNYLIDLDAGFYTADYLRAWIWEVQLRKHLEEKYGPKWFMDKKAGEDVADMWRLGKKYPVEELARMIGADGLSMEPLKKTFNDTLKK